jgi:DNA-binding response OmpR family regulator
MPPTPSEPATVAVFNASEDTVDCLTMFFERAGFRAVGRTWPAREPLTVEAGHAFLSRHQPDVVVFDVSLPYEANWERFLDFKRAVDGRAVPIVLTTTNKRALSRLIGSTEAIEILGKPYDLDQLAAAVRRALATA